MILERIWSYLDINNIVQSLKDYEKGISSSSVRSPIGYLSVYIYNSIFTTDFKNESKKNTYKSNARSAKTKFHNFEQRTNKYTAKELEEWFWIKRQGKGVNFENINKKQANKQNETSFKIKNTKLV